MCGCLSKTPYWGPGLQPRHVSWLGIEPGTLWFTGRHSIHWATPAREGTTSWNWDTKWQNSLWETNLGSWQIQSLDMHLSKLREQPQLVWLSGLSAGLWTRGSPIQFPVRAHAWVAGQVPSRVSKRKPHVGVSLPLFLPPFPLSKKLINKI